MENRTDNTATVNNNKPLYTLPEVAAYLNLGRSTVFRLAAEGAIQTVEIRHRGQRVRPIRRVTAAALNAFAADPSNAALTKARSKR
jgi:excisionase family DNA binding protein